MAKPTLIPKGKAKSTTAVASGTVSTTPTIDKALCNAMRVAYGETYWADAEKQEGSAVSSLSDEYLMKLVKDQQALQPATPITADNMASGENNPLMVAMAEAESNPQQQGEDTGGGVDISASQVRSEAAYAALALSQDDDYNALQGAMIDAERVRKQAPGRLAWRLEKLYVKRDDSGKVTCNMIEGTGPKFDGSKHYPWPEIGTKEKDEQGNTVNNPDIMSKYMEGNNRAIPVSFYSEVVQMTPRGQALKELRQEYLAATGNTPAGRFADQNSPNYLDSPTATKRAEECKNDIDTMTKSLKRAVTLLRHMWAVNEMAPVGQPPRCTASFRVERKWDVQAKAWTEDGDTLEKIDSPITVHDKVSNETAAFKIGEFLSHDPMVAAKNGGTLGDFRKAVGRAKKRAPASGTGKTEEAAKKNRVVLTTADLDKYIAAIATTAETPAAWANFQRELNKPAEESDALLTSTFRILVSIQTLLSTQPDLRARIATLEKLPRSTVDDISGSMRDEPKPSPAATKGATLTLKKTG